ncbi:hypothetical protein SAY86_029256 [Trapa natans]|uniref:Uncharacterized protein n=1 Tax=Trapa natans TaxID=22666 RepID=A0AAN7MGP7_TRANT|nr:hypothetical protein SAY86_029256 [Trapa natans]
MLKGEIYTLAKQGPIIHCKSPNSLIVFSETGNRESNFIAIKTTIKEETNAQDGIGEIWKHPTLAIRWKKSSLYRMKSDRRFLHELQAAIAEPEHQSQSRRTCQDHARTGHKDNVSNGSDEAGKITRAFVRQFSRTLAERERSDVCGLGMASVRVSFKKENHGLT